MELRRIEPANALRIGLILGISFGVITTLFLSLKTLLWADPAMTFLDGLIAQGYWCVLVLPVITAFIFPVSAFVCNRIAKNGGGIMISFVIDPLSS